MTARLLDTWPRWFELNQVSIVSRFALEMRRRSKHFGNLASAELNRLLFFLQSWELPYCIQLDCCLNNRVVSISIWVQFLSLSLCLWLHSYVGMEVISIKFQEWLKICCTDGAKQIWWWSSFQICWTLLMLGWPIWRVWLNTMHFLSTSVGHCSCCFC